MRVGVVDIGTNSTRLLVADVTAGGLTELDKRSIVTRLGEGLEAAGALGDVPQQRVFDTLTQYDAAMNDLGVERRVAVMTSAVRDASNGAAFAGAVRERFGLDGRTIPGDEEARLSFMGATAARDPEEGPLLVIDIGGGSTEMIVGHRGEVSFHVSTQVGVVRHTERHIHHDPPEPGELQALAADARETIEAAVPQDVRDTVTAAVAVAGTATSTAAIDLGLEPYDPSRVEGHVLYLAELDAQLAHLAAIPLDRRREVPGLHPDRAPTIVAGVLVLREVLGAFGLDRFEASERDILWGVALTAAAS